MNTPIVMQAIVTRYIGPTNTRGSTMRPIRLIGPHELAALALFVATLLTWCKIIGG